MHDEIVEIQTDETTSPMFGFVKDLCPEL